MLKTLLGVSVALLLTQASVIAAGATIALVQYDADSHYGDYDLNLENLTVLAESAASEGAQLIVLPEGSTYGYASSSRLWCRPGLRTFMGKRCDDVSAVAEDVLTGRTTKYWHEFAKKNEVTVMFSIMEIQNDQFFNTAVTVGPNGYIGSYQKRSLYIVDEAYATPGSEEFILELFGKSFGVMICMDTNYTAYFRSYKQAGADAIIAPMDWDQSPDSTRGGSSFFRQQASRNMLGIYVSDQASWDSTGFYPASGAVRLRAPLAPIAIGTNGYALIAID